MFSDDFYQTHQGEVFVKTRCMQHEHAVHNFLASLLENLGYHQTGEFKRQWLKTPKKSVVCLADSFGVCSSNLLEPVTWFDKNTVVLTDNRILFEPQYKVFELPSSYFGIYNYVPNNQHFCPVRRFGFSVNRFDHQRQLMLLELVQQSGGVDSVLTQDYINFNVWDPSGPNQTLADLQQTFAKAWQLLGTQALQYQDYHDQLVSILPIRNHALSVEQVHVSVFLNLVVETYADNATIALSEKIFRALVTPAPWTVYASTNTVNYLRSLGFDVLDDLVDHSYNKQHPFDTIPEKISKYISASISVYNKLSKQSMHQLTARCQQAAKTNQAVLKNLQQQWPADFAAWLPKVVAELE